MTRPAVTPGRLYALLARELRERRPFACQCRMPFPFLVEAADENAPNWRIAPPAPCAQGCDALIAEIAAAQGPLYELRDPTATPVKEAESCPGPMG